MCDVLIIDICNKLDKINELREEINKLVISSDIDKEALLSLSQKLDVYIVDYLKNKGCKRKKANFSDKCE